MKKFNIILAIIISLITLSFTGLFIFKDKKEFSENEFRYLEKRPEFSFKKLINGKFIDATLDYTNDHFPYRDFWVNFKTRVNLLLKQDLINNVYVGDDGYLFNRFDKPQNIEKIIQCLNNFYDNNKDVNIDMMLVPTSNTIYVDKLPKYNIDYDEEEVILYYKNNLKFNVINIIDDLKKVKNKNQLYYKTDHHWTSYGAYVAYQKYLEVYNKSSYSLNDFIIEEVNNEFLGTLYSKVFVYKDKDVITKIYRDDSDFKIIHGNRITNSFYEEKYLSEKDKYSYFLGNNEALIHVINNNYEGNDDLLIIKDSYANCLVPLLSYHYKNIYVIDPRFYNLKISDFIKENKLKNVLILYNVNTIDTDTGIVNIR